MATIKIRRLRSKKKLNYEFPVVLLSKSNKNISAQVLEPVTKKTLATVTSNKITTGTKTEKSVAVGKNLASVLKKLKYSKVVVDRNGNLYHGRIEALVEALRAEKIEI